MPTHMIKLVVGVDDLDHFAEIQAQHIVDYDGQPANMVHTRFKPKREKEILESKAIQTLDKMKNAKDDRAWNIKLRNAFDQARPDYGRKSVIWLETLTERILMSSAMHVAQTGLTFD